MKADDCSIEDHDRKVIRKQADLLLRRASAYGRFPTPIPDLVKAAELEVETEMAFDEQGIGELYRVLPNNQKLNVEVLKKAIGKVEGILHREDKTIFIDKTLHKSRQKFLTLHEVGHHDLPWQKSSFKILEDSEGELDESTRDQFEREANCFASDVWFQLDTFTSDARDSDFGIGPPIKLLTKRYGTSCYSTLRRYVNVYGRASALVVCDVDKSTTGSLTVRRILESSEFLQQLGSLTLPSRLGPESFFYRNMPVNKFRMPTPWIFERQGHHPVACMVEAYNSTKQIFFLVYPVKSNGIAISS